ncbi:amino acid racemase [Patescibacteria group bacterium]|nr:amino acid racemase [Patescibacteria group bacterium]MBP9710012.1 amino acid racemase [Patescibacteria group bacterium]
MKTLGILGGVGPQTTADIYLSVIRNLKDIGEDTYPPILIYNLPFPYSVEYDAIVKGENSEKMIPYLVEGAKILEKGGADFGILPCNTLHKYINSIREAVQIPFLSIIEEVVTVIKEMKVKKVGILASQTANDSKIYERPLQQIGVEAVYPSLSEQTAINQIIIELLGGGAVPHHMDQLKMVCDGLQMRGAQVLLFACTDLQMLIPTMAGYLPIIDTTTLLISASIREMIKLDHS